MVYFSLILISWMAFDYIYMITVSWVYKLQNVKYHICHVSHILS